MKNEETIPAPPMTFNERASRMQAGGNHYSWCDCECPKVGYVDETKPETMSACCPLHGAMKNWWNFVIAKIDGSRNYPRPTRKFVEESGDDL